MYMEKIISVKLFFFFFPPPGGLVEKCYIGFFLYIMRTFTIVSLVLSFILFLDAIF